MKYPPYNEYLDCKLDWLDKAPKGWDVIPIKFGLEIPITDGPHETPEIFNDGIPFLSAEAVKNDKLDFSRKRGFISIEEHKRFSKKYKPKKGDVYMIKSGATTGNVARVETDKEFNIWSPLAALRPEKNMTTTGFLFYFMKSKPFFHSVELGWSFGTQQNIGMGIIANLQMVFPTVKEQQKIADFLDFKTQQIDQLIKKKKALIEKLNEQRIAVITQAVTKGIDKNAKIKPSGVDWLGDVPEHWEVRRLKFSVDLINSKIEAKETHLPYIGMENIESFTAKKIYDDENPPKSEGVGSYFKKRDVLFGKLRPYLAKAFLSDFEGFCSSELLVFNAKSLLPEYLVHLVLSDWFIKLINSSTYGSKMPRASWDYIGNMMCPIPSKEEQKDIILFISSKIKQIEKLKKANEKIVNRLAEYRSALITSAVTGKIDIRNVKLPNQEFS